ncbi:MAG: hypothetical protein JWO31_193 [Phycisphaerales bacterium]|nr:hypothetical protein [Phycisphaerales bacterium]
MAAVPERKPVSTSLQTWLSQGEQLYAAALNDFRAIEAQLDDLEQKLAAKQAEVNQIAQVIGKPAVEGARRLSAQLSPIPGMVEEAGRLPVPMAPSGGQPTNSSNATIARALSGKFGR